ncbi:lytic transglycosylase domain-containing protein [Brevundimonas sp. SORGH_AS_0993]|uniref:lytic transglycosylase domain-containing protein n=1 Tax=Brevundimonas sp. SORGH_AS_0993 TaxID=3041794 RepID=UPI00278B734F|nr:lytic transglycosylase domain-containing protein [Brevundimonas sp. SORGH_AS_0993]MDQ1155185.1 soluble lytic murein transglycosylase-like protein [Brevundimonas sp. SORGH_AS_0993]
MVIDSRRAVVAVWLALGALGGVASAQAPRAAVDWRAAGGDLFGRSPPAATLVGPDEEATPRLPDLDQPFAAMIDEAAALHALDPKLLHAVVIVESGYESRARSPAGAGGLTQLMLGTAAELGVGDRFDPRQNLRGGAAYLARQMLRFGDLRLALAAYNAGPARVAGLGRVPDLSETQAYVSAVVDCYLALTVGRRARTARDCRPPRSDP